MKFHEAMKQLEEGRKVRRSDWSSEKWIAMGGCECAGSDCCLYYMRPKNFEYEWELYEEPQKLLSFDMVVKGLREEKKFRRKDWGVSKFISQRSGAIVNECNDIGNFFLLEDYEANDWIEVHD